MWYFCITMSLYHVSMLLFYYNTKKSFTDLSLGDCHVILLENSSKASDKQDMVSFINANIFVLITNKSLIKLRDFLHLMLF